MQMSATKIAVLFGIVFFLGACIKKKEFDIVPALSFQSYDVFSSMQGSKSVPDSAYLTFSFQDGDGDLGSNDSTFMSLHMTYFEDRGNGFVRDSAVADAYIYVPKLTANGGGKGLEGTFTQILKPAPIIDFKSAYPYQWRIVMVDQAGHQSNIISTPAQSK